jgi:tRNA-dihydrouridine synthase
VIDRLLVNASESAILKQRGIPLVAQIWGADPEKFRQSAALITEMGTFDGIDINMGCPVNKVVKKQCCAALINHPALAKEIVQATVEGTVLPVSVKTRIGFNHIITEEWISHLLETPASAITIHGRTQKMQSEGLALWEEIGKAVELGIRQRSKTRILGNGDVKSMAEAQERIDTYGVAGVMVGTGVFKNPWMFNKNQPIVSFGDRIGLLKKHIRLYDTTWEKKKNYAMLKRFYKIYLNSFPGAAEWRERLMLSADAAEALSVIDALENSFYSTFVSA